MSFEKSTGYFVDWNGIRIPVSYPGEGLTSSVVERSGGNFVEVAKEDGEVIFEGDFYPGSVELKPIPERFHWRDMTDAGLNVCFVRDEAVITTGHGGPLVAAKLIEEYVPDIGSPKGQWAQIIWHSGYACWCLEVDGMHQRATQFTRGPSLGAAVKLFEDLTGVALPNFKVIEVGVGAYGAKNKYASDNPWALTDGGRYYVFDRLGKRKDFTAHVSNGFTNISFDSAPESRIDPKIVLSAEQWNHMRTESGDFVSLLRLPESALKALKLQGDVVAPASPSPP